MAVTETRSLFNPKIEALAEQYAGAMGTQATTPFTTADITAMAPQVAPQTALQQQATARTTSGLGAYSPYVTRADAGLAGAGTDLATAQAGLGTIGTQYADPAKGDRNISHLDSIQIDIALMKKSKGHPLLSVHQAIMDKAMEGHNQKASITQTLLHMGERIGKLMGVTEKAMDPNSPGGVSINKIEFNL